MSLLKMSLVLIIVDTVDNTEIEPHDVFEQPSQTNRCSLCKKTFENDYKFFGTHKYTEYWDKDHKIIYVKCPFCGKSEKIVQSSWITWKINTKETLIGLQTNTTSVVFIL